MLSRPLARCARKLRAPHDALARSRSASLARPTLVAGDLASSAPSRRVENPAFNDLILRSKAARGRTASSAGCCRTSWVAWDDRILRNHTASDGGGIFNFGDLVVNASIINNNVADGVGGGLFTEGVATLNRSRVRFNEAASGGGIRAVNVLTLNETIVSDNIPDDCC